MIKKIGSILMIICLLLTSWMIAASSLLQSQEISNSAYVVSLKTQPLSKTQINPMEKKHLHSFKLFRIIRIILLIRMFQIIRNHPILHNLDKSNPSNIAEWMRSHPLLIVVSMSFLLIFLTKLSNFKTIDEIPNITEPNKPPYANAGGPYSEQVGVPLLFTAEKSYDEDGTIIQFEWDFGDGTKGLGKTISHQYTTIGNFVVNLTVTDNEGETATDTTISNIVPSNTNKTETNGTNSIFGAMTALLLIGLLIGLFTLIVRRRLFE
jgi:hypothetical protein